MPEIPAWLNTPEALNTAAVAHACRKHPATVQRYFAHGFRLPNGEVVKLRGYRSGRIWYTSRQLLNEFMAAINGVTPERPAAVAEVYTV